MSEEVLVLRVGDTVFVNLGGDIEEGTVEREEVTVPGTDGYEWKLVVSL